MPSSVADRNLLYGIFALQLDFINHQQLFDALRAWVLRKQESLGVILQEQHALTPEMGKTVRTRVERHLQQHGDEALQFLTGISPSQSLLQSLNTIHDPDLQA